MDAVDICTHQTDVLNDATIGEVSAKAHKLFDTAIPTEVRYCARCGEEIPMERLRIVPGTQYCVFCKERLEKER